MERRINIKNRERGTKSKNGLEFSDISNNWIFKIGAILISSVIFYSVYNSVMITVQKLEILKQAEEEVDNLRLTNLQLSIGIKDMSTDKYLEKEARDRLNFGGKNEVVFVIPETSLVFAHTKVEEIVNPKEKTVIEGGDNIEEWIAFLLTGI